MATTSLYLFKYNNYLNKILKRSETLQGYGTPLVTLRNANFNPNDFISTSHVFNTWVMDSKTIPDYCVVCDASDVILSRWFVINVHRTRGGQWSVSLLADLAADYKEELLSATCFIEKGFTNSSPFVFNNENMGFNQILSDLIPLENNLKTPWLVLYLARYNGEGNFNTFTGEFADSPTTKNTDYTLNSLSDYKYAAYQNQKYTVYEIDGIFFGMAYQIQGDPLVYEMTQQFINGEDGFKPKGVYNEVPYSAIPGQVLPTFPSSQTLQGSKQNWQDMAGMFSGGVSSSETGLPVNSYTGNPVRLEYEVNIGPANLGTAEGYNRLIAENGKTIKVGDEIYRIDVIQEAPPAANYGIYKISKDSSLGQEMRGAFLYYNDYDNFPSNMTENYYVHIPLQFPQLSIKFSPLGSATQSDPITYNFSYSKAITRDASYEIIAAPYNSILFEEIPGQTGSFQHSGDVALQWFQAIINKYNASNFAYDLQLVPYCPVDSTDLSTRNVIFCQRGQSKLALAIQLELSNFSQMFKISRFSWQDNLKLSNELDLYRIVSPNGVGEYEWSPAKNGTAIGTLPSFEVDCTLIPFHPYIKVNPYFGGLYGKDYNDYRGLICGGDFSLPVVNSEWETYQLNNKYYQDIFDRNIEHQEYNNKIQKGLDIGSGVVSALGAGAQGAFIGNTLGGPVGGVVGAIGGGLLSGAGAWGDVSLSQKLFRENIDFQKDQFGFELGTIKARSQSLTRTTSFNQNNKYFPYVEYYTCTAQEKQALLNKMKYNGMTIGVIGTIPSYLNPNGDLTFVQGSIIEIDISADAAIVERLNEILSGGIRIKNG